MIPLKCSFYDVINSCHQGQQQIVIKDINVFNTHVAIMSCMIIGGIVCVHRIFLLDWQKAVQIR